MDKSNVINLQEVKDKLASNTDDAKQINLLSSIIENSANINADNETFAELTSLLAMPDEQFALIAPVFLEEFDKIVNSPAQQFQMAQMLNLQDINPDQFAEMSADLFKSLNELKEKGEISEIKCSFLMNLMISIYNAVQSNPLSGSRISIPIQLIHTDAKMPTYAHDTDAGMDIYAIEDISINPGETKIVPTGLKIAIPAGYEIQIRPKSGRSAKSKLRVANTPGTIDTGYRDEIGVILENIDPPIRKVIPNKDGSIDSVGNFEFGSVITISKGEKIAQMVLTKIAHANWVLSDNIMDVAGNRGGGFGSTGLK